MFYWGVCHFKWHCVCQPRPTKNLTFFNVFFHSNNPVSFKILLKLTSWKIWVSMKNLDLMKSGNIDEMERNMRIIFFGIYEILDRDSRERQESQGREGTYLWNSVCTASVPIKWTLNEMKCYKGPRLHWNPGHYGKDSAWICYILSPFKKLNCLV